RIVNADALVLEILDLADRIFRKELLGAPGALRKDDRVVALRPDLGGVLEPECIADELIFDHAVDEAGEIENAHARLLGREIGVKSAGHLHTPVAYGRDDLRTGNQRVADGDLYPSVSRLG